MSRAEVERHDGVPVLRPREDIDAANADALRAQLAACVEPGTDRLIVDLGETRYIDSAGIDMLFRLSEILRQRRAALLLVIPPESNIAQLADIVGLTHAVRVHPSLERALGASVEGSTG